MMFLHTLRLAGDLSFYYAFAGFFAASFGGTPMSLVLVWPALCFGLASCFEGSRPLRTTLAALSAAALLFLPTGADKLCYFPAAVYPVLLANFTPAYDQSYEWTLDPEMVAQGYNLNRLYNETMDALSMNMVYGVDSSNTQLYMTYWKGFQMLWNELLPQIPLYSNIYITVYPDWLENYTQDSFWDFQQAILYATVAE